MSRRRTEAGIGSVGLIVTILIVVLLGAAGLSIYHYSKQNASKQSAVGASGPNTGVTYSGSTASDWSDFALEYSKIHFKYPATWQLKDDTNPSVGDLVNLYGSDNFHMAIVVTDSVHGMHTSGYPVRHADPVTFLSSPAYLVSWGGPDSVGNVEGISLSQSPDDPGDVFPARNTAIPGLASVNIYVAMGYGGSDSRAVKSIDFIEQDPNYAKAKMLIESMLQ